MRIEGVRKHRILDRDRKSKPLHILDVDRDGLRRVVLQEIVPLYKTRILNGVVSVFMPRIFG